LFFFLNVFLFFHSLSAFWPGLQVLFGDIQSAIESYERFYQIWLKYQSGLPERFDVMRSFFSQHFALPVNDQTVEDKNEFVFVHLNRGVPILKHYPLRPEFVESTYFLYQSTKDPRYLKIGKEILYGLKKHCK
jgi:mannosidase alpha-like ER degradation enhancer 1